MLILIGENLYEHNKKTTKMLWAKINKGEGGV